MILRSLRERWLMGVVVAIAMVVVLSMTAPLGGGTEANGAGAIPGTPPQSAAGPVLAPGSGEGISISAPKRLAPYRPFEVRLESDQAGRATILAVRRSGRTKVLRTIAVDAGTTVVRTRVKWLNVVAVQAQVSTEAADTTVSAAVRTMRKAYPRVRTTSRSELGSSWVNGCPVRIRDIRVLTISHVNYRGRVRRGTIVVHKSALRVIRKALTRAFEKDFRIKKMVPVSQYGGSDDLSMRDDNTSAFMCRPLPSGRWSRHAYGDAIDINPRRNPHLLTPVAPPNGWRYVDRTPLRKGMIGPRSVVTKVFLRQGWGWGAVYRSPDYQHFSSTGG